GVAVETFPCHIASLPVAVNIQCHAARRASARFENGTWIGDGDKVCDLVKGDSFKTGGIFRDATRLELPLRKDDVLRLKAGEWVLLNGSLLTGRDQTHRRLCQFIREGRKLPVDLHGQLIYYVGPTPAPPGHAVGAAGPTTSYRMDAYTPMILDQGVLGLMGKGKRSPRVRRAIKKYGAVYLATIGGAGAYLSDAVESATLVAFEDLGPEALFRFQVKDFPAIVINDSQGNDYYEMVMQQVP
ncbi:MAG: hypothetical protein GXO58_11125, partial [Thermodesulfobacteria bacterium]|nr:hypothetical protein [Thermodesulfobacteriota bacterium]